ncbi:MAG: hypothetical protein Q8Q46_00360 [Candidatus Giovannonibacteria bacterium]|nr:hypothetical protein [Candidatus Giovannonibacteria bacterium]
MARDIDTLIRRKVGPVGQKVLLLLFAGLALGLSYSLKRQLRILDDIPKEWKLINKRSLYQAIKNLYRSKLIDSKNNKDGSITIILTQDGQKKALTYHIGKMKIEPMKKWDKNWRIIIFDIPEKHRKARNALCQALKNMGCYPLQKSVLISPFECRDEADFAIEFFELRPYVRFIVAHHIDNELHLKEYFNLK